MPEPTQRVRLEEVDWRNVLPWTALFRSFRMAIHPPKLFLALLLVVLLYLGGQILDSMFGPRALINEYERYRSDSAENFAAWVRERGQPRSDYPAKGVFAEALKCELEAFRRLIDGVTSLRPGWAELLGEGQRYRNSVLGALREMIGTIPAWLIQHHRGFLAIYGLYGMVAWALLAGAIARLAALHATRDRPATVAASLRFAFRRWAWFIFTPLVPVLLALGIGLLLSLGGLLFNLPVANMLAGLAFVVALAGGLVIALLVIGMVAGAPLLYPALAVEGSDGLEAVSRVYNYVLGRPWRWLFYSVLALVYGVLSYMFFGVVIFLSLWATHHFVSWLVFARVSQENLFETMLPAPQLGNLAYSVRWEELGWSEKVTAILLGTWMRLAVGLLGAYAISYYLCVTTWMYLLLRKAADGTDMSEVALDAHERDAEPAVITPDEVDLEPGNSTPPAAP